MISSSLWSWLTHMHFIVQGMMVLLLVTSLASWTFIVKKYFQLKQMKLNIQNFQEQFWSGMPLNQLFNSINEELRLGLFDIFYSGFSTYQQLSSTSLSPEVVLTSVRRAMKLAQNRQSDALQHHLIWLATIGSVSPYIGLFGTVIGILTTFHAMNHLQFLNLALIAPGISEALIATAMGLFVAIPAMVAYNRLGHTSERFITQFDYFQEEFIQLLHQKVYSR